MPSSLNVYLLNFHVNLILRWQDLSGKPTSWFHMEVQPCAVLNSKLQKIPEKTNPTQACKSQKSSIYLTPVLPNKLWSFKQQIHTNLKFIGCTASAWLSGQWTDTQVLYCSFPYAPHRQISRDIFSAALLSPTHRLCSALSTSCHSLPALLPVEPCYIHKVCAPLTNRINNWRCCQRHSWQCSILLPYPHCSQKTGRAALQ